MSYIIFNPAAPPQCTFSPLNMIHDGGAFPPCSLHSACLDKYLSSLLRLLAHISSWFVPAGAQQHAFNMLLPYKVTPIQAHIR